MRRNALAVILQSGRRRLSRKLGQYLILSVVLERAADAQHVLSGVVQPVIQFRDKRRVVQVIRRVETEAAEIEASILPIAGIVANGILIQDFLVAGVQPDAQRIDLFELRWADGLDASIRQLNVKETLLE